MRKHFTSALLVMALAAGVSSLLTMSPNAQAQGDGQGAPAGRGGRGGPAEPALPTPRLADGTVNLGRVPGEKGIWGLPYITNMASCVMGSDGMPRVPGSCGFGGGRGAGAGGRGAAAEGAARGRGEAAAGAARGAGPLGGGEGGGGGGRGRGGSKSEPWIPFMPWSAAVYDYNSKNESKYDPEGYCLPPGGPRLFATPYPAEIIQLPEQKRVVMIFEGGAHIWREIYMDGRPHPTGDALNPTYLGHSVGRWEADTLVVDVVGFNENTWLDYFGHPHTDMLHVIEKFSRPDKNTLRYEATFDDPGAYTKPWTVVWNIPWRADGELSEYICQENNRFLLRLDDDFGKPLFAPTRE